MTTYAAHVYAYHRVKLRQASSKKHTQNNHGYATKTPQLISFAFTLVLGLMRSRLLRTTTTERRWPNGLNLDFPPDSNGVSHFVTSAYLHTISAKEEGVSFDRIIFYECTQEYMNNKGNTVCSIACQNCKKKTKAENGGC